MTDQKTQLIFEKFGEIVRPLGMVEDGEFISSVEYRFFQPAVYAMGLLLPGTDFPVDAGIERSQNGFIRLGQMPEDVFGFLAAYLRLKGYEVVVIGNGEVPNDERFHFFPAEDRQRFVGRLGYGFEPLPFLVQDGIIQERVGKEVSFSGHDFWTLAIADLLRSTGAICPQPQSDIDPVRVICQTVEQVEKVVELERCFRDFNLHNIRVVKFAYDENRGNFARKVAREPIVLPRQGEMERYGVNSSNWWKKPSCIYPCTFWCRVEKRMSERRRGGHFYLADLLRPFLSLGEYKEIHAQREAIFRGD